ncbi:SoxH protein, homolog [hydrothermal vent metagenome]|uniref:SoxH protein, homolog n=1 Tax=hydrothermal vent metagenome TaxID=652676 RepID=A0A3B0YGT3_9ZZZZ
MNKIIASLLAVTVLFLIASGAVFAETPVSSKKSDNSKMQDASQTLKDAKKVESSNKPASHQNTASKSVSLKEDKRYPLSTVTMSLKKVSKHVYYIQGQAGTALDNQGFISNASVIITPKGIIIVDALASPSLARLMLQKIRKISNQPIVKVISTHYHADHIYGLQIFKDMKVEIMAPAGTWKYLDSANSKTLLASRRKSLKPWINQYTRLVKPDTIISKETVIKLGGVELLVNYIGSAHSDGDLSVYVKTDKVLISGDLIFEGRVPYVGNTNTSHWLKSLKEMKTDGLLALIPGHGKALQKPTIAIQLNYDYLLLLRDKMKVAVEDFKSFNEAYKEVDWSRFKHLPAFKEANRGNAYRVYHSLEVESLK